MQTYRLRLDYFWGDPPPEEPIRQIALRFWARDDLTSIDILSITLIPKVANYADAGAASRTEVRNRIYRQALYTHTPGRVEYRVRVPEAGRLDFAMGVLRDDVPVTFRIAAEAGGGEPTTLFEESYGEKAAWAQRSVDLSDFAGQTVTLGLEADSEAEGRVALWGAPTVTGGGQSVFPNIIFYVIDGGGADNMSVYGYNRRTTPYIERLAAEGAVFDHAYSNSTWTRPSTLSFLTSLQHSVLGGLRGGRNMAPDEVLTIAQHLHRAGYQTATFTTNSNAGTLSGLERGVDILRQMGVPNPAVSSVALHEDYWRWREVYPAEPYWVHFQTTDVHSSNSVPPFAGLYVSPQQRATFEQWERQLNAAEGDHPYSPAFEQTGIDRQTFFDLARGLHDETMAHQDNQLGRLIARLKATGEWDHTLLIVAADHGHLAGTDHFGVGLADPLPPTWMIPMASSYQTRVPLVMVWPGHIRGGQRFDELVSMIDVLPTVLDLVGLPMPDVMQGQSLAPLLLDQDGWEPRPVILDEFVADRDTGELRGTIEVIDGRWAASLFIDPRPEAMHMPLRGHHGGVSQKEAAWKQRPQSTPRLLLYDLWSDPRAFFSVHEEHPDLVEKYTKLLEAQFRAALGQQFTPGEESPLTPEQLRTLRSLGYIR